MHQNAAIAAAFLLLYSAGAGRVERSWISGPIVFAPMGRMAGPFDSGVLQLNLNAEGWRGLAELALAMFLFADAARLMPRRA